jgi:hypothetical protein
MTKPIKKVGLPRVEPRLESLRIRRDGARCEPHGVLEPCPLCETGTWPLRDLEALVDFAGKALDLDEFGIMPGQSYVFMSEVLRSVGIRWAEIETVKQTALRPLYTTKNRLIKEARIGVFDLGRLEKAAINIAKGATGDDKDELLDKYIRTILDPDIQW